MHQASIPSVSIRVEAFGMQNKNRHAHTHKKTQQTKKTKKMSHVLPPIIFISTPIFYTPNFLFVTNQDQHT